MADHHNLVVLVCSGLLHSEKDHEDLRKRPLTLVSEHCNNLLNSFFMMIHVSAALLVIILGH